MQGQEGAEIVYTNAMAAGYRHDGKDVCGATVPVDIGDVDEGAARWWAALLAPGQGWKAILSRRNNEEYLSPWSISLGSEQCFRIESACVQNSPVSTPPSP